jgi:hypothetical protein
VEYTLNLRDYAALVRYHTKLSPRAWRQRQRRFVVGFVVGLLFLAVGGQVFAEEETRRKALAGMGAFLLIFLVVLPFFLLLRKYETYRGIQALRRDLRLFEPTELILSAEELTSTGLSRSTSIRWHAIQDIVEHEDYVFLFTAETEALILPRRAFADDRQAQTFIDTARRYHAEARRFVRPEGQA